MTTSGRHIQNIPNKQQMTTKLQCNTFDNNNQLVSIQINSKKYIKTSKSAKHNIRVLTMNIMTKCNSCNEVNI